MLRGSDEFNEEIVEGGGELGKKLRGNRESRRENWPRIMKVDFFLGSQYRRRLLGVLIATLIASCFCFWKI